MKKKTNAISILISIVIVAIIFTLSILFIISNKKEFSENENRYLEKFPKFTLETLKDGEFTEKLENYLADHFPFRDEFMGLKTEAYKVVGQTKINDIYLGKEEYMQEEYKVKPETTTIPIETLKKFKEKLPQNVDVKLMLVPTSTEIYSEKLPTYATNTSQKDVIDYVYKNITFEGIDVYSALMNAKKYAKLYYRTDHHWTTFGSYVAYLEFLKGKSEQIETNINSNNKNTEINQNNTRNIQFERVSDSFYGTFYSKTNDYSVKPDSIYKIKDDKNNYRVNYVAINKVRNTMYEDSWLDKKDKYSYFLGTNQPLVEITNMEANNEKQILIIKDSYANSLIPFIARDYKKTHVIDPRYFGISISQYIKDNKISEVLLVYNMKTIEVDLGIRIIS